MYTSNVSAPSLIKQALKALYVQLGHDTVKAGDFRILLSSLNLSKMSSLLIHVIDKLDLTDYCMKQP